MASYTGLNWSFFKPNVSIRYYNIFDGMLNNMPNLKLYNMY